MVKTFNPKSIVDNSFKKTLLDAPIKLKRKRVPGKVGVFFEKITKTISTSEISTPQTESQTEESETSTPSTIEETGPVERPSSPKIYS